MASATIEKVNRARVAPANDGTVMIALDCTEDARIVVDMPRELAEQLTRDLIAAGYGPQKQGGRA